jgi:hypothetical protein
MAWVDGKLVSMTEAEAIERGMPQVVTTRALDRLAKDDDGFGDALAVARRRERNRRKRERRARR